MRRYILTGTPGAGKTTVLRLLASLGYSVVEEAATAVIERAGEVEPSRRVSFIDDVVALQRRRQIAAATAGATVQIYDRSPICTYALSVYIGAPVTTALAGEVDRVIRSGIYQRRVFFLRNIGFCRLTFARRISFEDSLAFERVHEETYRSFGYELVEIPAGPPARRAAGIRSLIRADAR
jgi:predicted ATPase